MKLKAENAAGILENIADLVDRMVDEIEQLKAENAALREKLTFAQSTALSVSVQIKTEWQPHPRKT